MGCSNANTCIEKQINFGSGWELSKQRNYIDDSVDILKGSVSDEDEESAIDVHNIIWIRVSLSTVNEGQ